MKTYVIFSIFMELILVGCSGPTSPSSQNSSTISFLNGQIDGWNYGSDSRIVLCTPDTANVVRIYAASQIDSRGHFTLENLASPPTSVQGFPASSLMNGLDQEILENTLACSDYSAKLIYSQLRVENDSPSSWLGFVYREGGSSDYLESSGDFSVNYCYATKSVKLTGAIRTRTYAGPDSIRGEQIVQYNLSFEKGWNQEVQSFVSQSEYADSGKTIKSRVYSFTSYEPYQGRWIYSSN